MPIDLLRGACHVGSFCFLCAVSCLVQVVASNFKRRYEICYDPSEPDHVGEDFQVAVLDYNQKIPPPPPPPSPSSSSSPPPSPSSPGREEEEEGEEGGAPEKEGDARSGDKDGDGGGEEASAVPCRDDTSSSAGDKKGEVNAPAKHQEGAEQKSSSSCSSSGETSSTSDATTNLADASPPATSTADLRRPRPGEEQDRGQCVSPKSSAASSHAKGRQKSVGEEEEDLRASPKVFPVLDPTHLRQQPQPSLLCGGGGESMGGGVRDKSALAPAQSSSSSASQKKFLEDVTSFLADTPPFPSSTSPDLVSDRWLIRATQGHTIRHVCSELLLRRIRDPSELTKCVHGTYLKNWLAIRTLGLSRMHRNHIRKPKKAGTSFPRSVFSGDCG